MFLVGVSALGICAAGQRVFASDTTIFSYDAHGRLVATSISSGPNNGMKSSTSFDSAGNRTNYQTGANVSTPAPPPTNSPPTAGDDYLSLPCYSTETINVTANDSDPEGNTPLILQSVTYLSGYGSSTAAKVSNSSIQVNGSAPYEDMVFSYTVADSLGATSTGRLYVSTTMDSNYCGMGQ